MQMNSTLHLFFLRRPKGASIPELLQRVRIRPRHKQTPVAELPDTQDESDSNMAPDGAPQLVVAKPR